MREFFFKLHPDVVAFWIKGPLWTALAAFVFLNSTDVWPLMVGMLVMTSGAFASVWLTVTGLHIIRQCPNRYGLSTKPYLVLIGLHWLSAIAILYWIVVILTFDTPPFHVAGDLGRAAILSYSATFMLLWRTRMRGLVSLEKRHQATDEEISLA